MQSRNCTGVLVVDAVRLGGFVAIVSPTVTLGEMLSA